MCDKYKSTHRTTEIITAYTCEYLLDNDEHGDMSLEERFLPSVEEYFKAHHGSLECHLIKVEIRIVTIPTTPEEEEEYEQERERRRER